MSDVQIFPSYAAEALALAYVQSHDLVGKTAAESNDMYYGMFWDLVADQRERRLSLPPDRR